MGKHAKNQHHYYAEPDAQSPWDPIDENQQPYREKIANAGNPAQERRIITMSNGGGTLTAAELTQLLRCSKQTVFNKLSGLAPTEMISVQGGVAHAWSAEALLNSPLSDLLDQAAKEKNLSVTEMLARASRESRAPDPTTSSGLARESRERHADLLRHFTPEAISDRYNLSKEDRNWVLMHVFEHLKAGLEKVQDKAAFKLTMRAAVLEAVPGIVASDSADKFGALKKTIDRLFPRFLQIGEIEDRHEHSGNYNVEWGIEGEERDMRKNWILLPRYFVPAAKFFYLKSNLKDTQGSVPHAVLRTIDLPKLPDGWPNWIKVDFLRTALSVDTISRFDSNLVPSCPEDLRKLIKDRQDQGKPLVPPRIAQMIRVKKNVVTFSRGPKRFALDYLSCPGSMRLMTREDGTRVRIQPGDLIEGDDSTPGIAVCVPWEHNGTACADRYHAMLGRFQWLAFMDAAIDYVPSFTYVIRPRSSYRKEDVAAGMKGVCKAKGIPRVGWRFERGTWESKMVKRVARDLGTQVWTVHSPHNKIIETLFNRVWTRLAIQFPHADLGRYRGENEENCRIYENCKRGGKDPRQYFPTLETVIKVFVEVIAEHNRTRINSDNYGYWIPEERWQQGTAGLRPYPVEKDWVFAPWVGEWTVHGMLVGGKVPLFEEFSVPFDFSAPWLSDYHGAKVRCHFDPMEPHCTGTLVLRESFNGKRAGGVLGQVEQINEIAGYARMVLGWGNDSSTAGKLARQQAAAYVRRETRTIDAGGRVKDSVTEIRDGVAQMAKLEIEAPRKSSVEEQRDPNEISHKRWIECLAWEQENWLELGARPELSPEEEIEVKNLLEQQHQQRLMERRNERAGNALNQV